ncbi:MAG: amino acid adenylation domain-containing protein, partial [Acidobacteriota bacterium]
TAQGLDSLSAIELRHDVEKALEVTLPLESLIEGASLDELATNVLETTVRPVTAIPIGNLDGDQPVDHGQRALWYLHRMAPENRAYTIAGAARLLGTVDLDALERAFDALGSRHPALRTTFHEVDGKPVVRVADAPLSSFQVVTTDDLAAAIASATRLPFDLSTGPLFRVTVFRHGDDTVVLLAVHHIIADFWTLAIWVRELGPLYDEMAHGRAAELEPLTLSPVDVTRWRQERLDSDLGEVLLSYWKSHLEGDLPLLDLATDRPRPTVQTFDGVSVRRAADHALTSKLDQLTKASGATPYMVLLSAYQIFLHRYSGQHDVLVGTPTAVRNHPSIAPLAGYFVNPVVLRSTVDDTTTVASHLAATRQHVLGALAHNELPFPTLVERLGGNRDSGRSPLFQAMFVYQTERGIEQRGLGGLALGIEGTRHQTGSLELEAVPVDRQAAQFDLTLTAAEVDGHLHTELEVNAALFDRDSAERMLESFHALLAGFVTDPDATVATLPMLGEEGRRTLEAWNPPIDDRPRVCLPHLILEQARTTPDAIAMIDGERELTYGQMARGAARIARHLETLGVSTEVTVGICVDRSAEMVAAMLGIQLAGGIYVPLDPNYPSQRLGFTLEDSRAPVIITSAATRNVLPAHDATLVDLDDFTLDAEAGLDETVIDTLLARPIDPDNVAYLIYTSGSTGRPKGVAIRHGSAAMLVDWSEHVYDDDLMTGMLASTSICFDISVFELFVTMARGGTVILADNALAVPTLPAAQRIKLADTVPSAMAELSAAGTIPSSVEVANLAGEAFSAELVSRLHDQGIRTVYNLYGPSEDTTFTTWAHVPVGEPRPPVGRPIDGTQIYLVDANLQPVPVGVPGEVMIGGAGISRGYLGRPSLTADRYIPDFVSGRPGARLYRTGDLARWRNDGQLTFLGRFDHQVKVRGFRIEMGEIESELLALDQVDDAVVVAHRGASGDELVAYVVLTTGEASALRAALGQRLPGFMVPGIFVVLDALPRLPNGKINRHALPEPDRDRSATRADYEPPETEVEHMLVDIWREVLEIERIGIHDNFFELGGHSLMATRVLSRVRDAFGIELSVRALLASPTVAGLQEAIAEALLADADEETREALLAELNAS